MSGALNQALAVVLGAGLLGPFLLATSVGALAVFTDCWQLAARDRLPYAIYPAWKSKWGWSFCVGFGSLAGLALIWANYSPGSAVARVISFDQQNLYLKALSCGISIIALIRSKLIGRSEHSIGPDWIYSRAQKLLFRELRSKMHSSKTKAIEANSQAVVAESTPKRLAEACKNILGSEASLLVDYRNQFASIKKSSEPKVRFSSADAAWVTYCEAQARLAADFIGPERMLQHLGRESALKKTWPSRIRRAISSLGGGSGILEPAGRETQSSGVNAGDDPPASEIGS